ncbi:MAG: phosphoribosylformylglycinamidine synthase subunit PurL [Actinomycetota bacterium]|nr:phosphoribosylformylglycinamidine synthase subunit PurL [Actinomycetota bacterium]
MDVAVHTALGLTDDELDSIRSILGRDPNYLELAMYSVMWSEHCSYKSSRLHLRRLPSKGEKVILGPGENAGVIDAGDGIAVAIRMESHNHPSAIEPYQGAATGVGGILRDIFTMGARPIALLDSLRIGDQSDPRNRFIFNGVVSGISGYGNAVGVPTVGGEIVFDPTYNSNPLVNVAAVGVLKRENLVLARADGVGNRAILLGASTGRDGIGGVSVLASAGFGGEIEQSKRPSVQVGDPYEEKRLIEACLELLDKKLVVGIQDLGGAGLTCATCETAAKAGLGMDVFVDDVPRREPNMEPFEVMTSESQERMLAIVSNENVDEVLAIATKWEVGAAVVGIVTKPVEDANGEKVGILRIISNGTVVGEMPAASLADGAPIYDRPIEEPNSIAEYRSVDVDSLDLSIDVDSDVESMIFDPSVIYRQYDHQLFLNTIVGPGSGATLLRLASPEVGVTNRAIALSSDGNSRWCEIDPYIGSQWIVAESALNLALVGARPTAMVDCLNFGNPEHPSVMWQLSNSIDGIAKASLELGIPVVGGNVSLYNEANGRNIEPTPVLTTIGIRESVTEIPPTNRPNVGDSIFLVNAGQSVSLGGSRLVWSVKGVKAGNLVEVDFETHRLLIDTIIGVVSAPNSMGMTAITDISDGGLALALRDLVKGSGLGFTVTSPLSSAYLFAESPSRVIFAAPSSSGAVGYIRESGLSVDEIGVVTGSAFSYPTEK